MLAGEQKQWYSPVVHYLSHGMSDSSLIHKYFCDLSESDAGPQWFIEPAVASIGLHHVLKCMGIGQEPLLLCPSMVFQLIQELA